MANGYCPKCKRECEVKFAASITKNGKTIYPVKAKCFVIPQCNCTASD